MSKDGSDQGSDLRLSDITSLSMGIVKTSAHLLLLAAMVLAYLVVMTYPFNWIRNDALLQPGAAIFQENGILQSRNAPSWIADVIGENEITVRLAVESYISYQTGPARILTISRDHYSRNLTIGHEGTDLIIRLRRSANTLNGLPPYVIPAVFREAGIRDIVVSIREEGLRVWVDGELRSNWALPAQPFSHWDSDFLLALGNELTWERPWRGEISRAQIETASGVFDILSPLVIKAPGIKERVHLRFQYFTTDLLDVLLNLVVFIPIGLFTAGCLSRPSLLQAALIWLPVCLTAETLQLFIAGRYSSISDLLLNILGTLIGAQIYLVITRKSID